MVKHCSCCTQDRIRKPWKTFRKSKFYKSAKGVGRKIKGAAFTGVLSGITKGTKTIVVASILLLLLIVLTVLGVPVVASILAIALAVR